jgi:large subunit ribosomal protein L21
MDAEPGSRVELTEVLLVSDGDSIKVGSPTVDGAVVVAEVVEHGKGKKVINFKYKAKVRYRRKRGHRQGYTQLSVQEITLGGKTEKAPERRTAAVATPVEERPSGFAGREEEETPAPARRRSRAATAEATETAEPVSEASEEAEETDTKPATRRRRAAAGNETDESATESESKE